MTNQASSFTGLDPEVARLDLSRIQRPYPCSAGVVASAAGWSEAETLYRRFLTLKKHYPMQVLVPPSPALDFWQLHILNTRAYRNDCEAVFGRFIDYFPYLGADNGADGRERQCAEQLYKDLYVRHFGTPFGAFGLTN